MVAEITFPYSRDLPGTFLGLATNVGDALTYRVLTSDNTILSRSVIRLSLDNININQRKLNTSDGGETINNICLQGQIPYEDETGIFENQNIHLT